MIEKLHLNTSELRVGDLVQTHGMRVRLNVEPKVYETDSLSQPQRTVYAFDGTVENVDEVLAHGLVPPGFLTTQKWSQGSGWVTDRRDQWTIQGNDLAMWFVEREVTRWVATINVPGYLPMDDDPPVFEHPADAWDYLYGERQEAEDQVEYGEDDPLKYPYSDTVAELHSLATESHPDPGVVWGPTPGYDGDHDLGLNYSVTEL